MEASKRIFVDSNYFIAFFNPDDGLHEKARDMGKKILQQSTQLVISNFIFLETVTVTSQRMERKAASQLGRELISNPLIEIIHIDEDLQGRAWEIFQKIRSKNVSFVDCSIIACLQLEGIHKLLTFDKKDFTVLQKEFSFSFYQ